MVLLSLLIVYFLSTIVCLVSLIWVVKNLSIDLGQGRTTNWDRQVKTATKLAKASNILTFNYVPDLRLANQVLSLLAQTANQTNDL